MVRRTGIRAVLLGLIVLALGAAPVAAAPVIDGEFPVPEIDANNKIVQGPDGNMWVTLSEAGKDVAKITPSGAVTPYNLEAITASGIAVGPEGRIWITRNGGVTSFDPGNPEGTKDPTDIAEIGTAHSIVLGPDGNMWVATTGKALQIPPAAPLTAKPFPIAGLDPKDIDVAGSLLVVASFEHIYAVNTAGVVVGDQKVAGQAQGVGGNPNGQYAFTQPVTPPKEIGLLSPTAAPLVLPAEGTDPFGITLGADGAYWAPEFISDGLMRLTADGQLSGLTGFAKNSGPRQIAAGPGNTLWVTLEMTKKVGRVSGLEPPVGPILSPGKAPRTKIKKGPKRKVFTERKRAKVKFRFSSPDAGATFQCRMLRLAKKKAKASKAVRFRACKSPKTYRLRPGRYRFEVRAVLAGVPDATPAKRSFSVLRVAPIS